MRVLVTGASGFVGRHLLKILARQGHGVVAWSVSDLPASDAASRHVLDMRDACAVGSQDLRALDAVIHLAALAQVGASFSSPAEYIATNSTMQINLMEALLAQSYFPRVLIVSTGGVYRETEAPLTEISPVEPSNPYVVSKLTQEMLASYYRKRGLDVMVARPFNHIGPGQPRGYLVADVASQIAQLERAGGGTITVGNISSERDYTDVRDVVAAYSSLIAEGRPGETYNVCSGRSRSGEDILVALQELARVDFEVRGNSSSTRPVDPSRVNASNTKIREATGWSPEIEFETTLADTLDYWRARCARGELN